MPSSPNEIWVEITSSVERSGWLLSVVMEKRGKRGQELGLIASRGGAGCFTIRASSAIACETVLEARISKLYFGVDKWVRHRASSAATTLELPDRFAVPELGPDVLFRSALGASSRAVGALVGVPCSMVD